LAVPAFFGAIETTALSTWIRESDSVFAFYFILCLHTLGLSLIVGASTIVDLRILGVASNLPLKPMKPLFNIMWGGFVVNFISGVFLLIAYPTKAFTNPMFYFKLTFIALALIVVAQMQKRVFGDASLSEATMIERGRKLAMVSLVLWLAAITAGRLLAYTYTYILYGREGGGG
jgi:hypothetical protein